MTVLLTGAKGYIGAFLCAAARDAGHEITALSRRAPDDGTPWQPFDLDAAEMDVPADADVLIHAAFDHAPGRYRGGEGSDPEGFLRRNLDGSLRLFSAARAAGVRRAIFLSTRAVYGDYPAGTVLCEDMSPRPDSLYGDMKWKLERGLAAMAAPGFVPVSLRVTGVYGAARRGAAHKWQQLFADFEGGVSVSPRVGTEVHGADLARAVWRVAKPDVPAGVYNVSDLYLDRHDLLAAYAKARGLDIMPPARATGLAPNVMSCARLQALGWQPGGWGMLHRFLAEVAR